LNEYAVFQKPLPEIPIIFENLEDWDRFKARNNNRFKYGIDIDDLRNEPPPPRAANQNDLISILVHRFIQGIYADGEYNVNKRLLLLDAFWWIELSSFHSTSAGLSVKSDQVGCYTVMISPDM
jgi:hypothetical protein